MLGTSSTPYDLRFRLLGVPVRVHPLFWLTSAMLAGSRVSPTTSRSCSIWIGCVFVSILVHEYGHALMDKRFHGRRPSCSRPGRALFSQRPRDPGQRLAVLLAGPGAGFLFCWLSSSR